MTSLVAYHGPLAFTALCFYTVFLVNVLDQGSQYPGVLKDLRGTGLVRESVVLAAHEIDGPLVLVVQRLVGNGNGESMATVFAVPSVIPQFSYVKGLVDEEAFQVQNDTKVVLEHDHG